MKQTARCLLSFFLLLCDGLSAQTTEKQDSMPSSPQQRIKHLPQQSDRWSDEYNPSHRG